MRGRGILWGFAAALAAGAGLRAEGEFFDRARETLTFSAERAELRGRISGALELDYYRFDAPAPGLLYTKGRNVWVPRLPLFVDVQLGSAWYAFAQVRFDRGFDPTEGALRGRLDEYALRWSGGGGRVSVQAGKFATIVGNWAPRHDAWENPFITAPLPYENLTPMWDGLAVRSTSTLLRWAHIRPVSTVAEQNADKHQRIPIIWGPSYATGVAASARVGDFVFTGELKNAGLSSRPSAWGVDDGDWRRPAVNGRVAYVPSPMWTWGVSVGTAPYLLPIARATLAPGTGLGDYRQDLVGADMAFAWHHVQVWAEAYAARFRVPYLGDAKTFSYYAEAKYKFTPQLFGSVRWNQQSYGTLPDGVGLAQWGRDLWRGEVGLGYRFTPNAQLKFQAGVQHEEWAVRRFAPLLAWQFVLRF